MSAKELVVYHANCTDGFTAAWVFHRYAFVTEGVLGKSFDFYPANYNGTPPDMEGYAVVYFVDFSYPRSVIEELVEGYPHTRFVLIDHHITAIKDLAGVRRLEQFTNLEKSGARLAWDYLFPGTEPPRMLDYVQDRDLWQWKLPMSRETSAYIQSLKPTFEAWDLLMLGGDDVVKHSKWASLGKALLDQDKKTCEELARGAVTIDFAGHKGIPLCNAPGQFASNVGHLLCEGAPFSITYHFAHGKMLVSLRSRDDALGADVGEIAKRFGGGGHKHAAGFSRTYSNIGDFFNWLADTEV